MMVAGRSVHRGRRLHRRPLSWSARHSYHLPERNVKTKKLEHRVTGMLVTAAAAPGIMIAVTLVTYISCCPNGWALVVGVIAGLVGWPLIGYAATQYTTVDRANPLVYKELRNCVENLQVQVNKAREQPKTEMQKKLREQLLELGGSLEEAEKYIRSLDQELALQPLMPENIR